jgi:molybdopterin-synthase adenylyltransferase
MLDLSRQSILIGEDKQKLLSAAKVTIIGVGALGTVAAELLVRSGVNNLILIDRDLVEASNLQRQTLFTSEDLGLSKVTSAKKKLLGINPDVNIKVEAVHLNSSNVNLIKSDLILDCTDNLDTRFLINDYCKKNKLPFIYAAAIKNHGYVLPVLPDSACLSCILQPASIETCNQVGVLNTITSSIAAMQINLAIKIITKDQVNLELVYYNIDNQTIKKIKVNRKENCLPCNNIFNYLNKGDDTKKIKFCSTNKFHFITKNVNFNHLKEHWQQQGKVIEDEISLKFQNILLFKDGRVIISAQSEKEAKSLLSQWIGN